MDTDHSTQGEAFQQYDAMECPNCGEDVPVDSVRRHTDGRKRVYWECADCDLSIMIRDADTLQKP